MGRTGYNFPMKLLTFNIFDGGNERLQIIIDVIKSQSPDYVTINEANTFSANNNKILKQVAKEIGTPYFDIALSGDMDYHVAVFSKYRLLNIRKLQPLDRACLISETETPIGLISIASLHLTPFSEKLRDRELDLILEEQKSFPNRILTGDMNSLSVEDNYPNNLVSEFNKVQLNKFTSHGSIRFDAVNKILSLGYYDAAVLKKRNHEPTVPTLINEDLAHSNLRLDYCFISKSLVPHLKKYKVVKNNFTNRASDHYPIITEFA